MQKMVPGALAGVAAAVLLAAPAFAGPTVTVRVEGAQGTLLDSTRVTLPDTDTLACGDKGPHTAADALDLATGGNWDRQPFAATILGETHSGNPDFWAEWIGGSAGYEPGQGVCNDVVAEGEEVLMYATVFTSPATHFPLDLQGLPAGVEAGKPVTVTVVAYESQDFTTATPVPVSGATVSGGGASAVTGADGTAVLTFAQPGEAVVRASKPGSVVSAGERVTVVAPGTAPPPPPPPVAGGPDRTAPTVTLSGVEDGKVYARKRAPRLLRGTVGADPSGLKSVRLSIARERGKRCWAFDGERERFRPHRCGGTKSFRIGDEAEWSYLLPKRLGRGRYTIRVIAIDKAGNVAVEQKALRVR